MNLNGLNFDRLPPFTVPRGFFLVAPIFGILAAIIIAHAGPELWLSRWHPATLALTHIIVLGVITLTICGAIFQLLPVLGGINIPKVTLVAQLVLTGVTAGTLLLAAGFYFSEYSLFYPAVISLGLVLLALVSTILWQCYKDKIFNQSINAIKLGFAGLSLVILIALLMLGDYLFGSGVNATKVLTDHHATWGLVGWVSLIIIGVSFQVLPMFHVAPAFPHWCSHWLPRLLFITLVSHFTLSLFDSLSTLQFFASQLIKVILITYGVTALGLLSKRKRKIPDVSVTCWQLAYGSLIGCCLVSLGAVWVTAPLTLSFAITAIFIFGWIISVIMAMIIKIMPFLAYLHLQQLCGCHFDAFAVLPNVHQLLNKAKMKLLLACHVSSLSMLLVTLIDPQYYWLLATALLIQFGFLATTLMGVNLKYQQTRQLIENVMRGSNHAG